MVAMESAARVQVSSLQKAATNPTKGRCTRQLGAGCMGVMCGQSENSRGCVQMKCYLGWGEIPQPTVKGRDFSCEITVGLRG